MPDPWGSIDRRGGESDNDNRDRSVIDYPDWFISISFYWIMAFGQDWVEMSSFEQMWGPKFLQAGGYGTFCYNLVSDRAFFKENLINKLRCLSSYIFIFKKCIIKMKKRQVDQTHVRSNFRKCHALSNVETVCYIWTKNLFLRKEREKVFSGQLNF